MLGFQPYEQDPRRGIACWTPPGEEELARKEDLAFSEKVARDPQQRGPRPRSTGKHDFPPSMPMV